MKALGRFWAMFCTAGMMLFFGLDLGGASVMTVWEGRQQYNKCKTYEESAESRQLMKMLGGMIQSERGDV